VALKAHFAGGTLVRDVCHIIATASGSDFLDKPWMAADPTTGNVYLTWTNFRGDGTSQIELQRCDADLNPIGPLQVVHNEPDFQNYSVQGSYPTVGPNGEIDIPWTVYTVPFSGLMNRQEVARSIDHGATFGPLHTIASFRDNPFSGGPGSRRTFGT